MSLKLYDLPDLNLSLRLYDLPDLNMNLRLMIFQIYTSFLSNISL